MKKPLVIYHGKCNDGIGAAWVARKIYKDAEFYPAFHGTNPPDVKGRNVLMLDFSYKREAVLKMKEESESLLVLDHHMTAFEDLKDLDFCIFDMNKSGASLTWDYFFKDEEKPWLVSYIEDRDLWRFNLPFSREINSAITSFGFDFKALDALDKLYTKEEVQNSPLVYEGKTILRHQDRLIEVMTEHAKEINVCGHKVLAANASCLFSDVANRLSEGRPFGVAWYYREDDKYVYSFRSKEMNVGELAKSLGGGGHRNAAGCVTDKPIHA